MEGSENAINRVGRAMLTVWGYLTGAVGRYLRPEVRNEEDQNVEQEDTVPISKSYKELKVKDEEKERAETKMREDLQCPGVRVRAAAVQWEKGNFAHHEDKVKSKLTCAGSEAGDKKSQTKKDNEKPLDDTSGSRKTHGSRCTEPEDSPAKIDADAKNQDRTFSGSEEADPNVKRNETNQEQTKESEEEEKIMRIEFDETEEEPIKSDQGYQEQGNEEEEEHGEIIKRENDETETEGKTVKSEFIVQGLLAKEAELNVGRSESNQITTETLEEEGVEIMRSANDETGEELTKSESIEQFLLAKEADLNVERSESFQEQKRKQEEEGVDDLMKEYEETGEELTKSEPKEADLNVERDKNNQEQGRKEEGEDEIMWRENDETEEEPMKSQFTEKDLLVKEADLRDEHSQEQRREYQEEEEESVDEILKREYEETEEEPIKSIEQGLLAKEVDINVERDESYQEQGKKQEEEDDEIMKSENDETEEEPIQSEFIDLDVLKVQRSECSQQQAREEEEEGVDEILRRENEEIEKDLIKSKFIDQGLLAKEADQNVEKSESSQEQRREEEKVEEGVDDILKREYEETEEEPIKSEFIEQGLLAKESDLNVERDEKYQEQGRKQEEEDDEIMKSENDETEEEPIKGEFIEQGLLAKESDLNVESDENYQEQGKEEEGVDEIMTRENDESEEEPIQSEFINQEVLNVQRSECSQEQAREEEEEGVEEILRRENNESEKEPIKIEFIDQGLLTKEVDLNVGWSEKNQAQIRKEEEEKEVEDVEIMKRENDKTEEEPIKSEFSEQGLLAKEVDVNVEQDENYQEPGREQEEEDDEIMKSDNDETEEEPIQSVEMSESIQEQRRKEEGVDEILRRENEEIEKDLIKSKFIDQGLLAKEADQNVEKSESSQEQRMEEEKEEEGVDEILRRENNESEKEPIKIEFIDQGLLTKEVDLNVERSESFQEQKRKQEEEGVDDLMKEYEETGEELNKSEPKEADLNVERDKNNQEQGRKEEGEDEIMWRENDETEEEPMKSQFTEKDLLVKEADLRDEHSQEQRREYQEEEEEESVDEILKREYEETEEEPIKSEFIEQGLLAKEVDINVERDESYQEQGKKQEEEDDEIMKSENDETEEEPIQSEFIDLDVLNVQRSECSQQQAREEEEEGVDEILRRENEEIEKDLIKSKFIDQGLLAKEADQNVEKSESSQEQRMEEEKEEEGVDEILRRENNESEKEPIKIEFIDQGLLTKAVDLNVGWSEKNQAQIRKEEEEKEVEDVEIMKRENDQTEEEPIKSEFTEQGLLAKEVDVNVERDENYQEPGREQEEEDDEIMKSDNDETEEEPIQSVEMSESIQEQRRKEEGVDDILRRENDETEEEAMKGKFIDQGFYPEEPAGVCDLGATAEVHMASVDTIMQYVYNQDKNELNVEEQSCHVTNEHENKANKLQMVDEGLFIQLASTCEGRDPLNPSLKLEVEMPENATLLQEKEVIEVHNKETMQEAVGNEKDGYHEGFSACEQFTDTSIVEEQKVCDMEMKETLKQAEVIDRDVETESELLAVAQIENAEMYKKMFEPSSGFDDEDKTVKMQQSEQSKEQKATSEMELDVELRRLDDTVHDHKGSQSPSKMTKQVFEGAITQPETETGNQRETVETTSKFRAEVAAVDVKKSAERETTSHEQPVDEEEVAAQEIAGQCFLALQGSLLEDLVSADTRINEAPFTGIKSIPLEETVVESLDEMKGSSLQELDEWSSEAELNLEAKSSSPDQTAELFERQPECEISVENDKSDKSVVSETPVETPINRNEFTEQDASSHGLSEIESEQETLEMQTDSQKDTEERKRPDEADNGLVEEIKDVTFCLGVEEEITSVLTKDSEDSEREMEERKEHTSEPESCEETSESSMNVELLSDTRECEAEMTDVETMVDSTGWEIKEMEEPIHQEEEMDKCHLVSSESEEISREHEEKVEHGESVVDSKEDAEDRGRSGLKRVFEKITGDNDKDKPSVLTDLLLPSQASSLDFTVQKSKIAVKNPLVRPPKDPRTLINMASVEPLTPHPPHPSLPGFLKKSHIEGASLPSKGVIGFKLPGLGSGFPALRKTEAGGKIRGGEDSESVTSQKPDSGSQPADDNVKQETSPQKPKWTPPRQPGMGNPMMMAELKGKLKKPAKD